MIYTLSMFNTGQVTLPKGWRKRHKTKKFIAVETEDGGLLIRPLLADAKSDEIIFYEDDGGCGLYCEKGLDFEKLKKSIEEVDGEI